jgi:hypothetical protein
LGNTRTERSQTKLSPPDPSAEDGGGESIVELCTPAAIGQTLKLRAVSDAPMIEALLERGWQRADV